MEEELKDTVYIEVPWSQFKYAEGSYVLFGLSEDQSFEAIKLIGSKAVVGVYPTKFDLIFAAKVIESKHYHFAMGKVGRDEVVSLPFGKRVPSVTVLDLLLLLEF